MSDLILHKRSEWTKSQPAGTDHDVIMGKYTLYVHYSEGAHPSTQAQAREYIRNIRAFHTGPERGWSDIGYSYLGAVIAGKFHVYGGRGLHKVPAAQQGANTGNLAICFLGNESTVISTVAVRGLAEFAERYHAGALAPHSHQNSTSCPGPKLRAAIPKAAKRAGIKALS